MTEGVVKKYGAWWVDCLSNRQSAGHTDCWYASGFDFSGDQSDGLMTHGSGRHQQCEVYFVGNQSVGECGGQDFCNFPGRVYSAHKSVSAGAHLTDNACCGYFV